MFTEILGLPAHPLWVHAPVVLVPLLALLSAVYALVPGWRNHTGWAAVTLSVVAPLAAGGAVLSGGEFLATRYAGNAPADLLTHRDFGTLTFWCALALGVVTVAFVLLTRMRERGGATPSWVLIAIESALLILAAASMYFVIRTGHTGATSVWETS
ncbi:DUF2231 domain-containing protein [Phytomonospora sp. NPDC050363]|uniref:DUF2231 domain-containing protein n=1 Tax=Phytomonospora sp. NPDC050363 TaxID=3155642 RepID=UPI0033C08E3E